MKKYIISIIGVLLLLFYVSSMSYEQQTIVPSLKIWLKSQPFEEFLSKWEFTYWGQTISVETRGYFYFIEFLIRKGLHFIGYGCIAILFLLSYRKLKLPYPVLLSILTAFIIASLDEYRQTFVTGRTGIFDDVLLDTTGAITFISFFKLIQFLRQKLRKHVIKRFEE